MDKHLRTVELLNEGIKQKRLGQYDKAIENYKEAVKLEPTNSDCYCNMAKVYYLSRQFDKSVQNYLKCAHIRLVKGKGTGSIPGVLGCDICRHIGHAFVDVRYTSLSREDREIIDQYTELIAGKHSSLDPYLDEAKYGKVGLNLIKKHVRWESVKNSEISRTAIDVYDSMRIDE